jgi:hypothetical protein
MPYSSISAVLNNADMASVTASINSIKAVISFAVNLTPDERRTLSRLGDSRLAFVTKVMDYAQNNANLIPSYSSLTEANKDFALEARLRIVEELVNSLRELVDDTRLAVGHEVYDFSLAFYANAQEAAKRNVPGTDAIVNDLKQAFEGQGGSATPADNA